jgi:histidinol dehydrogenase
VIELIDSRDADVAVRIERPTLHRRSDVDAEVRNVVEDVRLRGDPAVLEYASRFDGVRLSADMLQIDQAQIGTSRKLVPPDLIEALQALVARCQHACQRSLFQEWTERGPEGVVGELARPLPRAGIYSRRRPAGRLSSLVASVVPAQLAGVEGVAVCAAPTGSGEIPESVLAACAVAGVDEVYRIGGAHAIAALAYGTGAVRPVDKVVGSGGAFARAAQRLVRGWVGTGPDSGPAELLVIADETAPADRIAADLAANAAAGPEGSHVVLTWLPQVLDEVVAALDLAVASFDRSGDLENALIEGGRGILVRDLDQAMEMANAFAPARLMLCIEDAEESLPRVRSAGSVLLGNDSPAVASPIISGSGGLLPTGGSARWDSGLFPRDFVKTIVVSSARHPAPHGAAGVLTVAKAEAAEASPVAADLRLR